MSIKLYQKAKNIYFISQNFPHSLKKVTSRLKLNSKGNFLFYNSIPFLIECIILLKISFS